MAKFQKGWKGGPGRPKGSRNKFSQKFIETLAADFEEHGVSVIETLREKDPAAYARTCTTLIPKDFQVEVTGADGEDLFKNITIERIKATDS